MVEKDDWRLGGQDRYLLGQKLYFRQWTKTPKNDHDHCAFCWDVFSDYPDTLHQGYTTRDNYHWVCQTCYNDFKDMFKWTVVDESK